MTVTIHSLQQFADRNRQQTAELCTDRGTFNSVQNGDRTDLRQLASEILAENGIDETPNWDCELPGWAT